MKPVLRDALDVATLELDVLVRDGLGILVKGCQSGPKESAEVRIVPVSPSRSLALLGGRPEGL
jgi:hypothetical protein